MVNSTHGAKTFGFSSHGKSCYFGWGYVSKAHWWLWCLTTLFLKNAVAGGSITNELHTASQHSASRWRRSLLVRNLPKQRGTTFQRKCSSMTSPVQQGLGEFTVHHWKKIHMRNLQTIAFNQMIVAVLEVSGNSKSDYSSETWIIRL